GTQRSSGRAVEHELALLLLEDHAVVGLRGLTGGEAVEDVLEHLLRRSLERVTEATARGDGDGERVAGGDLESRHLRGPVLLALAVLVLDDGRVQPVVTAEHAPGDVRVVALALARDHRVREEGVLADDADAAAVLAGRGRFLTELMAVGPH